MLRWAGCVGLVVRQFLYAAAAKPPEVKTVCDLVGLHSFDHENMLVSARSLSTATSVASKKTPAIPTGRYRFSAVRLDRQTGPLPSAGFRITRRIGARSSFAKLATHRAARVPLRQRRLRAMGYCVRAGGDPSAGVRRSESDGRLYAAVIRWCSCGIARHTRKGQVQSLGLLQPELTVSREFPLSLSMRLLGSRPLDLHVHSFRSSNAQYLARIVRREIAAAAVLQPGALHAAGGPRDRAPIASRLHVTPSSLQRRASGCPAPALFCSSTGGPPLFADQHVRRAVVVVVADRQAARGTGLANAGPACALTLRSLPSS